jgi:hypothetical protein
MIEHPGVIQAREFNRIIKRDYSVKIDNETCYRYILSYKKEVIRRFFNINVLIEYYKELIREND